MVHSLTEENYLKAILSLSNENGQVNVNHLSKHLSIKMPTVTAMMKKLHSKKLVQYEAYKPLKLTDKGKKVAALVVRKHRLTEMFLVEKMGFGWEEVHDIAEQIEHIQSTEFFNKMDELLGFPKLDPHGSPIPDKHGKMVWKEYAKLSDCKKGDRVKLTAVINTSEDFLKLLNNKGLHLGSILTIKAVEAFDGSMVVSYEKHTSETLSQVVCDRIRVEII